MIPGREDSQFSSICDVCGMPLGPLSNRCPVNHGVLPRDFSKTQDSNSKNSIVRRGHKHLSDTTRLRWSCPQAPQGCRCENSLLDLIPEGEEEPVVSGKYQLSGWCGYRDFFNFYLAKRLRDGREFSFHMLLCEPRSDKILRDAVYKGALNSASLIHQAVARTEEVNRLGDNSPFIVTEPLSGSSLNWELRSLGRLNWRTCLDVFASVVDGVAYAHDQCVYHTNLSSRNIFLQQDGTVKILDFGVAERLTLAVVGMSGKELHLKPEFFCGDVGSIAPEVLQGSRPDARSDIFSLGCAMFESVSGLPPFLRSSIFDTLKGNLVEEAIPIPVDCEIPRGVSRLIARCLCKEPERRFQRAVDLRSAIQELLLDS